MNDDSLTTPEQREHLQTVARRERAQVARLAENLQTMAITEEPIDSIKPNPWNPNRQSDHDFELLLRSIEEDGFTQPIVCTIITEEDMAIDKIQEAGYLEVGDTMIVDGEHRWRACRKLGRETIYIVTTPMNVSQAMISTLRHNRARGSEDFGLAADVLRDLQALGSIEWAQDSLMLDDATLNRILEDIPAPQALAGEEFAEAWIPDRGTGGDHAALSEEASDVTGKGGDVWRNAGTAQAVEQARDREQRLREAHSEEQREMIRRDTQKDFFRVSLIFSDEEGRIVKGVLGGAPAETLVDLCREKSGDMERALGEGWVTIESIIGSRVIPGQAAQVIKEALDLLTQMGDIGEKNRWQGIEYMAAEFASGAIAAAHRDDHKGENDDAS